MHQQNLKQMEILNRQAELAHKTKEIKTQWVKRLNVSSQYADKKLIHNAVSLNNQYNFSKIKNKQYEPTNAGA